MITCLHTAEVHVATFAALLPEARHVVRSGLLDRAREAGIGAVADETRALLADLSAGGPLLCTCSTLGPIVDDFGEAGVLRIDRPAMEAAAAIEGEALLVICLQSTEAATRELFESIAGAGRARMLLCSEAWPYFEAGDQGAFARTIAGTVRAEMGGARCVVLAQASMAVAAPLLDDLGVPVLTTPALAAEAVRRIARG